MMIILDYRERIMNRIDQAIIDLARAFCQLKQHDEVLYTKALQSLVALALSEEKIERVSSIERDMQLSLIHI